MNHARPSSHLRRVHTKKGTKTVHVNPGVKKRPLKFYDMKAKKSFSTDAYDVKHKGPRVFAVAKTPGGSDSYHILAKDDPVVKL